LNQKEHKTQAAEQAQKDETCFHWLILLEETGKTGADVRRFSMHAPEPNRSDE
jgi:hypothetical protein